MASKYTEDHRYTEAEIAWLTDNIANYSYPELVKEFNAVFGLNISYGAMTSYCIKSLKIKRGVRASGAKKGEAYITAHNKPIGSERKSGIDVWVKVANDWQPQRLALTKNPNWQRKKDYVWERHYGEKPKGGLIVFLDGNRDNFAPENLYCVSRVVNFMMVKNKWYTTNRDLTLTAIKYCELFYALRGELE